MSPAADRPCSRAQFKLGDIDSFTNSADRAGQGVSVWEEEPAGG